jgi:dTDP-4-amino-4,6-dideoxygalactose transaminase
LRRKIRVCKPLLPRVSQLEPFLSEIDHSQWYSNFGPMYWRFRDRLAALKETDPEYLTLVANGTSAITLCLRAMVEQRGHCMVPAWTFPATPMAVVAAGLEPWFVDIDRDTWSLTPDRARAFLHEAPFPVQAIVPVAPFGGPVDVRGWDLLSEETGIPVIIDAAAGFDSIRVGRSPSVVSFHATKAFGIGEGGGVFSSDTNLTREIYKLANFGLYKSRIATVSGMNAKLSEYASAVGMAAADEWPSRRARFLEFARCYIEGAEGQFEFQPGFGDVATATAVVWDDSIEANALASVLGAAGIETLRWWRAACPDHPAFSNSAATEIPVALAAAKHTLGLPMSIEMDLGDIEYVLDRTRRALGGNVASTARP